MPTYGCFKLEIAEPVRTWIADYIVCKGSQIQFWNRASAEGGADVLVGVVRLGSGQTICDASLTDTPQPERPSVYQAIFAGKEFPEPAPILG